MTTNTTARAKTIFCQALEIASDEERELFVQRECGGDDKVRGEVMALLQHERRLGKFLEGGGSAGTSNPEQPVTDQPGTVIGPYTLIEQIGEGGFGVVFLAEQVRPIRRKVALKVVKPGMDTRACLARFEAERQVLALMDHPHIARVFDAGATESGRPYFVMELVLGVPITDYCDQCQLTTRERLELFVLVCRAVQHAHQKGVIHRDIKPTNVLVALQDGRPAPKIIDFGVAKALSQRLTGQSLTTGFAPFIGTPMYMSPEQAELSPLGVDTRSDVYALGVLLYELLTGTTPFDKDRLHAASYDDLRRIIREEDPPRPSARISTLAADQATTVRERRRADRGRLTHEFRGELDWIVMKCLEKDRNRRYETVAALALDVERHLHNEPVEACPPSAVYRLRKFARRNKGPVLAASLVLVALVGGVIGTTWGLLRALAERDQKVAALEEAQQAINDYFTTISDDPALRHEPRLQPLRRRLLERALLHYGQLVQLDDPSPDLQAEQAVAYSRIAILTYELGTGEDWLDWLDKSTSILEELLDERHDLSRFESLTSGQRWLSQALFVWFSDPERARRILERSCRIGEELVRRYPHVDGFQNDLAAFYYGLASLSGRVDDERKLELNEKSRDIWRKLADKHPSVPEYWHSLADCVSCMGSTRVRLRQSPQVAEEEFRLAIKLAEDLFRKHPHVPGHRAFLASMHEEFGFFLEHAARLDEAEEAYQNMLTSYEAVLTEYSGSPQFEQGVLRARLWLGELVWHTKGPAAAALHVKAGHKIGERLASSDPFAAYLYAWSLANCADHAFRDADKAVELAQALVDQLAGIADGWMTLGIAHYRRGDHQDAIDALERAITLPMFYDGCPARFFLAMAYAKVGRNADARRTFDAAMKQLGTEYEVLEYFRIRDEAAAELGLPIPTYPISDHTERIMRELIVFGASMCDNGNAFILSKGQVAAAPYFDGRLTNGPVWVERLAERLQLGVPGEESPVPAPSEAGGTNYAVGGAKAGDGFSDACVMVDGAEVCAPNLGLQIEYFLKRDRRMLDGDELIIVQGGHNNAFEADAAAKAMADHVATLAAAGGKLFLVPNLPRASQSPGNAPEDAWDRFVAHFNARFEEQLAALEAKLGIVIVRLDLLALTDEIIVDPEKYGFTNVSEPACPGCGFGIPQPDAQQTIVANPAKYLYWDDHHFTAEANRIIGDRAFERVRRALKALETNDNGSE